MGAHFEALYEGVLVAPLESRYTQVGFNLISVHVCYIDVLFMIAKVLENCLLGPVIVAGI